MTLLLAATLLAVAFPDVAPIIEKRCVSCHQPGEIAPMAFTSYEEVRPWAKAIRAAVIGEIQAAVVRGSREKRPHANSRALMPNEIATLVKWVDAGPPKGKPATIRTRQRSFTT